MIELLSVDIPKSIKSGGKLVFYNDMVKYNNIVMKYSDIESISYYTQIQSIFIKITQTFEYKLTSINGEKIKFVFGAIRNQKNRLNLWTDIIKISQEKIEPIIVSRLVSKIFETKENVKIGDIIFSKDGYSKQNIFGGYKSVKWTNRVFIPQLLGGKSILWDTKHGKNYRFASIPMKQDNAVVLPGLVNAIVKRVK